MYVRYGVYGCIVVPDILLRQFFLSFFLSCLVDIDDGVLLLYSRRSSMRVFHDLPYISRSYP